MTWLWPSALIQALLIVGTLYYVIKVQRKLHLPVVYVAGGISGFLLLILARVFFLMLPLKVEEDWEVLLPRGLSLILGWGCLCFTLRAVALRLETSLMNGGIEELRSSLTRIFREDT